MKAARETFDAVTRSASLPFVKHPGPMNGASADFEIAQGRLADVVEVKSRLCDLVVTQGFTDDDVVSFRTALETTLLGGRPVLLAPEEKPATFGERVAVAFDGGAPAAHSVTAAMPFLSKAKSVTLIKIAEELKRTAELDSLADYLALRGIETTKMLVEPSGRSVSDALFGAVQKAECDLLIMGAYGHQRVREVVFGGVTRDLLSSKLTFPVLTAH
jgi:nucleotide-binding universal stress UspA family protein